MGLCLFALDGDVDGPDAGWSYGRFADFRRRLAAAEGFTLDEMVGFGGDRKWSTVQTALEPLLDHPDDDGELSSADCAAVATRLAEIIEGWTADNPGPALIQQIGTARDLVTVMVLCIAKGVPLAFG